MSQAMELTRVELKAGRYEGHLRNASAQAPVIELVHQDRVVAHATLETVENGHRVIADLPASVLSDGVQVIALRSAADGVVLDRLTLLAGAGLDGDFRSEMALMREELELLKRAFRRHCLETGAD
ncbi:MAG: hypothetical protein AAGA70_01455 [Pseudomonadota bacterium]